MQLVGLFAIVLCLLCTMVCEAVSSSPRRMPRGRRTMGSLRGMMHGVPTTKQQSVYPSPRYFTSWQDNFDPSNPNRWQQAFYVNATFYAPGGPAFLCVGGEGPPIDGSAVVSSVHCNDAVELLPDVKGIMFAVEHRFYGCHNMSACPVSSFANATEALRFLSSRQALADLATFHDFATVTFALQGAKWVVFGGSYPGMLSSFLRLKYPDLVVASVASSAPVFAEVKMDGYNNVVAEAYLVANNNVGGSQACADAIRTGHATIGEMFLTQEGRKALASRFDFLGNNADWYAVYDNQMDFAGNGVAYFPAQLNDPSCTQSECNIGLICQVMTNASIGDPVTRLATVAKQQSIGRASSTPSLLEQKPLPDFWGYQTCTEFGFYQTCEVGTECFFTQGYLNLSSQEDFCATEFGISLEQVRNNIAATNEYYGGREPYGTCILYPNGEVDPWHANSILSINTSGLQTLWVEGASHHFWTHPTLPTDQPSVVVARKVIQDYVKKVLATGSC